MIIERFAEDYAIVEEKNILKKLSKELLDPSCREGDVIEEIDGKYYPNKEKTERLRKIVIQRLKRIVSDDEKGQKF